MQNRRTNSKTFSPSRAGRSMELLSACREETRQVLREDSCEEKEEYTVENAHFDGLPVRRQRSVTVGSLEEAGLDGDCCGSSSIFSFLLSYLLSCLGNHVFCCFVNFFQKLSPDQESKSKLQSFIEGDQVVAFEVPLPLSTKYKLPLPKDVESSMLPSRIVNIVLTNSKENTGAALHSVDCTWERIRPLVLSPELMELHLRNLHQLDIEGVADKAYNSDRSPSISHNNMLNIKEQLDFAKMIYLQRVTLRRCGLSRIPSTLSDMLFLEELDLSYNEIRNDEKNVLKGLSCSLWALALNDNQLDHFPEGILDLVHLRNLNMAKNQLTGLPFNLFNLVSLKYLNVDENERLSYLPICLYAMYKDNGLIDISAKNCLCAIMYSEFRARLVQSNEAHQDGNMIPPFSHHVDFFSGATHEVDRARKYEEPAFCVTCYRPIKYPIVNGCDEIMFPNVLEPTVYNTTIFYNFRGQFCHGDICVQIKGSFETPGRRFARDIRSKEGALSPQTTPLTGTP